MTILLYGRLADLVGAKLDMGFAPAQTVRDLRQTLAEKYPVIADELQSPRVRACVGDAIVPDTYSLAPDDQVEFFPPVSGG